MSINRYKFIIAIFLLNLILRLCFVSWHPATYTDSINYIHSLDRIRGTYLMPGYPFAIVVLQKIFGDPILTGRLVSILFAAGAVSRFMG